MKRQRQQNERQRDGNERRSWWQRLTGGLKRTSSALGGAIADLVTKRKLDAATIAEIEDVLMRADLGLDTADAHRRALGEGRYDKAISPDEVKAWSQPRSRRCSRRWRSRW